ncbi:MAG TPA: tRNA lysidine(34) synthetase TilS, partial [Bacteroidales bacterium]
MIEAFRQFIEQQQLCLPGDKILVAVSGGMDSVVLLDLFSKTNFQIAVAHCNFSLRGAESDEDEQFVKELCLKHRLDFFVKKFDTKKYSKETGLSIQEAARNLRYEWFDELAEKHSYNHIAVAHHFDDQAETFFINLFRGSGVSGLKGMPVKRGKIIRPLLFSRRAEIEKCAIENKLNFREDSSNSSDNYLRNRIRHNILPEIEKLANNFQKTLDNSLEYLAEDEILLKQLIEEKKQNIFLKRKKEYIIPKISLLELDHSAVWLFYLLRDFGFNRTVASEIFSALLEQKVGKVFMSDNHQVLVDRDQLILREKAKKMIHKRKWHLRKKSISLPLKLTPLVFENTGGEILKAEASVAYFDFEKLKFPLL